MTKRALLGCDPSLVKLGQLTRAGVVLVRTLSLHVTAGSLAWPLALRWITSRTSASAALGSALQISSRTPVLCVARTCRTSRVHRQLAVDLGREEKALKDFYKLTRVHVLLCW